MSVKSAKASELPIDSLAKLNEAQSFYAEMKTNDAGLKSGSSQAIHWLHPLRNWQLV